MQLYAGRTRDFVHAATHNAIAQRLADAFSPIPATRRAPPNSIPHDPDRPRIVAVFVTALD